MNIKRLFIYFAVFLLWGISKESHSQPYYLSCDSDFQVFKKAMSSLIAEIKKGDFTEIQVFDYTQNGLIDSVIDCVPIRSSLTYVWDSGPDTIRINTDNKILSLNIFTNALYIKLPVDDSVLSYVNISCIWIDKKNLCPDKISNISQINYHVSIGFMYGNSFHPCDLSTFFPVRFKNCKQIIKKNILLGNPIYVQNFHQFRWIYRKMNKKGLLGVVCLKKTLRKRISFFLEIRERIFKEEKSFWFYEL